jgi:hypothetical protein
MCLLLISSRIERKNGAGNRESSFSRKRGVFPGVSGIELENDELM